RVWGWRWRWSTVRGAGIVNAQSLICGDRIHRNTQRNSSCSERRTRGTSDIASLAWNETNRITTGNRFECAIRRSHLSPPPATQDSEYRDFVSAKSWRFKTQLTYSDAVIERVTAHDERVQRLRTVPSVGPVTAAAA